MGRIRGQRVGDKNALFCIMEMSHQRDEPRWDFPANSITALVRVSTRAIPVAGRGFRSAGEVLPAAGPSVITGTGGGVVALPQRVTGPATGGSGSAGAGVSGDGGAGPDDDPGVGGAAESETDLAPAVRLGGGGVGAEQGDLLACYCGVC